MREKYFFSDYVLGIEWEFQKNSFPSFISCIHSIFALSNLLPVWRKGIWGFASFYFNLYWQVLITVGF